MAAVSRGGVLGQEGNPKVELASRVEGVVELEGRNSLVKRVWQGDYNVHG